MIAQSQDIFTHHAVGDTGQPVLMLAPMEGVTAHTFRDPLVKLGAVDMVATEFIRITSAKQKIEKPERYSVPLQIQVMATEADMLSENILFLKERELLADTDWLDLNVGCPSKKVTAKGAGSALLCTPGRLVSIIEGMRSVHRGPLSIKTRIGYQKDENFPDILKALADCPLDFLTVHARTKMEGYTPGINLMRLEQAVKLLPYPVIGNGDVWQASDVLPMLETGVRGIMCGRGALRNPLIFNDIKNLLQNREEAAAEQRKAELLKFARTLCDNFLNARKSGRHPLNAGPYKEFGVWFSKNPLIGRSFFEDIKRIPDLQGISSYLNTL